VPAMSDESIIVRGQGTIFHRRLAASEGRDRRGGHIALNEIVDRHLRRCDRASVGEIGEHAGHVGE
jgi:hypothetical protein